MKVKGTTKHWFFLVLWMLGLNNRRSMNACSLVAMQAGMHLPCTCTTCTTCHAHAPAMQAGGDAGSLVNKLRSMNACSLLA
jgi:hypothetical protein